MSVKPLEDRVLIKPIEGDKQTASGIYLPDSAQEKPIQGKVLAVGNGKILDSGDMRKLDVKVGDKILFGKYSGTEITLDDEEYLIMRESDILGIVDDD